MKQLRWTFLHLRLWVFELKLWMDGLSWEEVRIVAEGSQDLVRATRERSRSMERRERGRLEASSGVLSVLRKALPEIERHCLAGHQKIDGAN